MTNHCARLTGLSDKLYGARLDDTDADVSVAHVRAIKPMSYRALIISELAIRAGILKIYALCSIDYKETIN